MIVFGARAIPAEQKIKEIEEGIVHYETKVLENKEQIFNHMKSVIEKASERSVVSSIGGMQLVYNNFFEEYKKIIVINKRRGEGKGIRWITSIDKDSIELVKDISKCRYTNKTSQKSNTYEFCC